MLQGTTPLAMKRPANAVTELRFSKDGHAPLTRRFAFAQDDEVVLTLTPLPVAKPAPPREPVVVKGPPPAPVRAPPTRVTPTPPDPPPARPGLVDPYATEPPAEKAKKPELKEGVY